MCDSGKYIAIIDLCLQYQEAESQRLRAHKSILYAEERLCRAERADDVDEIAVIQGEIQTALGDIADAEAKLRELSSGIQEAEHDLMMEQLMADLPRIKENLLANTPPELREALAQMLDRNPEVIPLAGGVALEFTAEMPAGFYLEDTPPRRSLADLIGGLFGRR